MKAASKREQRNVYFYYAERERVQSRIAWLKEKARASTFRIINNKHEWRGLFLAIRVYGDCGHHMFPQMLFQSPRTAPVASPSNSSSVLGPLLSIGNDAAIIVSDMHSTISISGLIYIFFIFIQFCAKLTIISHFT